MKSKNASASRALHVKSAFQIPDPIPLLRIGLLSFLVSLVPNVFSATLTWDPGNTANGGTIDPGSGSWDLDTTTNVNWNNGTANVSWTQLSTTAGTNNAVFTGATGANYVVNLDQGGTMNVSNLLINSSGYTFIGGGLYLQNNGVIWVADGQLVTFSNTFVGQNNAKSWFVGNGATFYEYGNEGGDQLKYLTPTNGPGGVFVIGGTNSAGVDIINATVVVTNGGLINGGGGGFFIGDVQTVGLNGGPSTNYTTGHLIINGGTVNASAGGIRGSRMANGHGVITLIDGSLILASSQSACIVGNFGGGSPQTGTYEVFGGQFTLGTGDPLLFFGAAPNNNETAILYQTNGLIRAAGGIAFGFSSGAAPTGTSAMLTNSGGFLYVGANGIALSGDNANTNIISLSGGTVGALANWSSSMPMILDGRAGNITFQSADDSGIPFNISLSGALTGPGGLYKTGAGTLTLSGTNNYAGSTVVSNGVLAIITGSIIKTNGAVTLDGSAGNPWLAITNSNPGQKWQTGPFTFAAGSPTIDFEFGSQTPSGSTAPVQVGGNLNFAVTPTLVVGGSAIPLGTFPLMTYSGGTFSGTLPASVNFNSGCSAYSGYITNLTASKTVALVVSGSIYNPAIYWAVGSGTWDISTTASWSSNTPSGLVPVKYADGDAVEFDDTATGPSPIVVTLNTTVNPFGVTANNLTNSYVIGGQGGIAGSAAVNVAGGGTFTLATANSYTGGTVVSGGSELNINNPSALGTGTLAVSAGSVLDNTTTSNITLQGSVAETWSGGNPAFTYLGTTTNLNMGNGGITMSANSTVVVASNTFALGGSISDNGNGYTLTKGGPGTLSLLTGNNFGTPSSGGLTLNAGRINLGDGNAVGGGAFRVVDGVVIDNVSGGDIVLSASELALDGSTASTITFPGTSGSIDFGNAIVVQNGNAPSFTFNVVSNTVTFESDLITGNVLIIKTGQGVLNFDISPTTANNESVTVNQGEFDLGRQGGNAVSGNLTVQSNALARITGVSGDQINNGSTVTLNTGGILDLNGNAEQINNLVDNNGVVRNGTINNPGVLNVETNRGATVIDNLAMTGTNCVFDVPLLGEFLTVNAILTGTGSLVETGQGVLTLPNDNVYTGNTTVAGGVLGGATLALTGSISNSAVITVYTNAVLDVTGRPDQTLTLNAGQTFGGNGSLNGNLISNPGSTVAPGAPVGMLSVTNNVTLQGNLVISLSTSSTPASSQLTSAAGPISYGGTLTVTNVGPALTVGTTFHIFPSAVSTFSQINLATTDAAGYTYTWFNNITGDGSIRVTGVTPAAPPINPLPGPVQFRVSGGNLSLGWPTNLGWILQNQTNTVAAGLGTNWVAVPGSATVTNVNIPVDPSQGGVFYRLVHP